MHIKTLIGAICWGSCIVSPAALAGTYQTLPLAYGINQISFGPGASAGMAVLAHRENFNAHSFDVLTLYIKPASSDAASDDWQVVTVFDKDKESLNLTAGGGADCVLHDFRLVRERGKNQPMLLVADREPGTSYADPAPVQFKYYQLDVNRDGDVGRPLYAFKLVKTAPAKKPYCDVERAFKEELGIGDYRRGRD